MSGIPNDSIPPRPPTPPGYVNPDATPQVGYTGAPDQPQTSQALIPANQSGQVAQIAPQGPPNPAAPPPHNFGLQSWPTAGREAPSGGTVEESKYRLSSDLRDDGVQHKKKLR